MYINFFLSIFFLTSRGLFELISTKSLAYMVSFSGFFIFFVFFIFQCGFEIRIKRPVFIISIFFVISSILSAIISHVKGVDSVYLSYLVYPIYFSALFLGCICVQVVNIEKIKIARSITLLIYVLFSVGCIQEVKLIDFPGATPLFSFFAGLDRPSSLTGSYLHYPLIMVSLGCMLFSVYNRMSLSIFVAFLSTFIAFSRSGMMLVVFIFVFNFLFCFKKINLSVNYRSVRNFFIFVAFFVFVLMVFYDFFSTIWLRMISSFDFNDTGNDERLNAWNVGFDYILNSNVFFGNNFGVVTNLTGNLFGADSVIVESGFLQSLINFGVVGTLIFYGMLIYVLFLFNTNIERSFILSFIMQTFIYQSTEVLPFITAVFIMVMISSSVNFKKVI